MYSNKVSSFLRLSQLYRVFYILAKLNFSGTARLPFFGLRLSQFSKFSYDTRKNGLFPFAIIGLGIVRVVFQFLTYLYNQQLISYGFSYDTPYSLTSLYKQVKKLFLRKT